MSYGESPKITLNYMINSWHLLRFDRQYQILCPDIAQTFALLVPFGAHFEISVFTVKNLPYSSDSNETSKERVQLRFGVQKSPFFLK